MSGHDTTHTSLLARLADGSDGLAWQEFCIRYGELIRGFARRRHLQPADCDDVLQDVLMALSRSMPGFQYDPAKGRFRAYLKTIVEHVILQRFRQSPRPAPYGCGGRRVRKYPTARSAVLGGGQWRRDLCQ